MTAATLTLTDFLLARIAEDEEIARYATSGPWRYDPLKVNARDGEESVFAGPAGASAICVASTGPESGQSMIDARHIATHDPARVLAECEAKRAIVDEHRLITDPARLVKVWRDPTPGVACERCANDPLGDRPLEDIGPCDTLLALAAVYADHPDYCDEWRP